MTLFSKVFIAVWLVIVGLTWWDEVRRERRGEVTTIALPDCPSCRQSATAVYNKQLGCNRCQRLTPIAKPEST